MVPIRDLYYLKEVARKTFLTRNLMFRLDSNHQYLMILGIKCEMKVYKEKGTDADI
jgi:hypothetical protein